MYKKFINKDMTNSTFQREEGCRFVVSYFPLESACQKSRIAPLIGLHVKKFKT
jgi:hypothetical protein